MKLSAAHAPRAVGDEPGNSAVDWRALTWKTCLPLFREGTSAGTLIVCGLNPSTAWARDGVGELDPTNSRIHGLAVGLGVSDVCMVNLYPFRHTDPKDLWNAIPWNFDGVASSVKVCEVVTSLGLPEPWTVVAAWGATVPSKRSADSVWAWRRDYHHMHVQHAARYLRVVGHGQLWCWGTTKAGHPRHPLYLPATAKLQPWSVP